MAGHAPYIMPDGSSLKSYLRERESSQNKQQRRKGGATGKQAQMDQILLQRQRATEGGEVMELNAMESVGVRRRRRWLNDKILRDLAGPMTAYDMHTLFEPAPFGGPLRPSPLAQIAENQVWDSFRSIDPEKEAKVLQKWAEYNRQQQEASSSGRGSAKEESSAAAALRNWARVPKSARQALRKANVHSVLQLEVELLEYMERDDATSTRLTLPMEDGFARLLVHGLAHFYGLLSSTAKGSDGSEAAVSVYHRADVQPGQYEHPDITCTDVLLALAELGSDGLTHVGLKQFVKKHIHGSETTSEAGWVVVGPAQTAGTIAEGDSVDDEAMR